MATRWVSAELAARLAAARTALQAAYDADATGNAAWFASVAQAHRRLARLLIEQQGAMHTADDRLRRAVQLGEGTHPDLELYYAVCDARSFHEAKAVELRELAARYAPRPGGTDTGGGA